MADKQRTLDEKVQNLLRPAASVKIENENYTLMVSERIGLCRGTWRSNCIGTALYVTGEINTDSLVSTIDAKKDYADRMIAINDPVVGCLAAWEDYTNDA